MSHRYILYNLARCNSLDNILYGRFINVLRRMITSDNSVVNLIFNSAIKDSRSYVKCNLQHIACNASIQTEVLIKHMTDFKQYFKTEYTAEELQICNHIAEIRCCLDGLGEVPGFSNDELTCMYDVLAIM